MPDLGIEGSLSRCEARIVREKCMMHLIGKASVDRRTDAAR